MSRGWLYDRGNRRGGLARHKAAPAGASQTQKGSLSQIRGNPVTTAARVQACIESHGSLARAVRIRRFGEFAIRARGLGTGQRSGASR